MTHQAKFHLFAFMQLRDKQKITCYSEWLVQKPKVQVSWNRVLQLQDNQVNDYYMT